MLEREIKKLRRLADFESLVVYLRDELDWPIEVEDADEVTFDYDPAELGIDPRHAVKIEAIKQVRPLVDTQPWGIFYIEFETKRLPMPWGRFIIPYCFLRCNFRRLWGASVVTSCAPRGVSPTSCRGSLPVTLTCDTIRATMPRPVCQAKEGESTVSD
jgi:hypothetical protein